MWKLTKRFASVGAAVVAWATAISFLWVLALAIVPPPVTWLMAQQGRQGEAVRYLWRPMRQMPTAMPMAVIAAEDQLFLQHAGFDLQAMQKALDHNAKGKRVRGASTISQQTAKNVFLWPGRTWLRKGLEAWFTLLIEGVWGKQRILEVYLNVAETGKGRFGVEATAQACFKRAAAKLSNAQCALIAAVLPSPRRYHACAPSPYVRKRQNWILRQMGQLGDLMLPEHGHRPQQFIKGEGRRGK